MTIKGDNLRREYEQIKFQEKSRFEILHAVHKQEGKSARKEEFQQQLTHTMRKMILLAQDDPVLLQTVIQIIQEEEQCDEEYLAISKTDDFDIVGRPKQWKVKTWEGFKQTIANRIEQIPKDTSETGLTLYLERLRQAVINDLLEIKQVCVPLFPDDWDVFKDSVVCYHDCITKHLEDIVSGGLETSEMTQLLVWINEYTGPAMWKNSALGISNSEFLGSPLSYQTLTTLRQRYLDEVGSNLGEWLLNALKEDITDWYSNSEPHRDVDGYFYTSFPVFSFKMINEKITQASLVRDDIKNKLISTGLKELQTHLQQYTNTVKEFINKWSFKPKPSSGAPLSKKPVEEPQCPVFYIQHTVAILNNYYLMDTNLIQLKDTFGISEADNDRELSNLKNSIMEQSRECLDLFLSALQTELRQHFDRILTRKWLDSTEDDPVDTVCQRTTDYTSGMRLHYYPTWLHEIERYSIQEYIRAMMEKRIVCKTETMRKSLANKIDQDVHKLQGTFASLSCYYEGHKQSTEWEAVTKLADIIEFKKTTISYQITAFVNLYPDVQSKQLSRILRIRGDYGSRSRKKLVSDTVRKPEINSSQEKIKETIFSAVNIDKQIKYIDKVVSKASKIDKMSSNSGSGMPGICEMKSPNSTETLAEISKSIGPDGGIVDLCDTGTQLDTETAIQPSIISLSYVCIRNMMMRRHNNMCVDGVEKVYDIRRHRDLQIHLRNTMDKHKNVDAWEVEESPKHINAANINRGLGNACCRFDLTPHDDTIESILATQVIQSKEDDPQTLYVYIKHLMNYKPPAQAVDEDDLPRQEAAGAGTSKTAELTTPSETPSACTSVMQGGATNQTGLPSVFSLILDDAKDVLHNNLHPNSITLRLQTRRILSDDEAAKINDIQGLEERVAMLLAILKTKDARAYREFMNALREFDHDLYREVKMIERRYPSV